MGNTKYINIFGNVTIIILLAQNEVHTAKLTTHASLLCLQDTSCQNLTVLWFLCNYCECDVGDSWNLEHLEIWAWVRIHQNAMFGARCSKVSARCTFPSYVSRSDLRFGRFQAARSKCPASRSNQRKHATKNKKNNKMFFPFFSRP